MIKFIEDFSLFIKQCYHIAWSVEKNTEGKNPKVARTKNRIIILSKFVVCDSKILKFVKEQEVSGLLSSLRIKTPLSKIPLSGRLLF